MEENMRQNQPESSEPPGWINYNVAQGLLTYAGKVLLVGNDYGGPELVWSLPGGRLEPGEQHPAALQREVYEETGLKVEVGDLLYVVDARTEHQRRHYVTCVFNLQLAVQLAVQLNSQLAVGPPVEPDLDWGSDAAVRAARWVPYQQIPALLQRPSLGEALVNYLYYGPQKMPRRYWAYPEYLNPDWQVLTWPPGDLRS